MENKINIEEIINTNGVFFPEKRINGIDTISLENVGYYLPTYVFYNNKMTTKNIPLEWYINKYKHDKIYTGGTWGVYELYGDTIKTRYITSPGGRQIMYMITGS